MGNICSGGDDVSKPEEPSSNGNEQLVKTNSCTEVMERKPDSGDDDTVVNLTQRQRDDCQQIFSVFEEDDEKVDVKHIAPMMRALNYKPCEEEITSVTHQVDKEHDSKMVFQLFLRIMAPCIIKANEKYSEDKIQVAFERFDKDHNGYITASELKIALQEGFCAGMKRVADALTDEDIEEIMNEADLNGDGMISYSEFKEMIPHLNVGIHTSVKIK